MLIRFAVENFLSYKKMTEFKMGASKIVRHKSHIIKKNGKRILKGSFLFGANASGKSNLFKAINFAKKIVLFGFDNVDCDKKYFRIDNSCKNQPGVFQFDIFSNGKFYSYGFAVSYLKSNIVEEWLYEINDSNEKCIFLRKVSDDGISKIKTDIDFDEKGKLRFDIYTESFANPQMASILFLSDISKRSPEENQDYQAFINVLQWFTKLIIIFPDSQYQGKDDFVSKNKEKLLRLLKSFDTGILSLNSVEKKIEDILPDFPTELKSDIKKKLINLPNAIIPIKNNGELLEFQLKNDELYTNKILIGHGNNEDLFDFKDESDGTQRLFDLIPIFEKTLQECVILIDELDRSLHTMATMNFVKYFYEIANESQLIVTTHDSNILDLDILRQDEIWFVEKNENQESNIFSLEKFNIRYDKKIQKDYILGRYGAIPVFNQLEMSDNYNG